MSKVIEIDPLRAAPGEKVRGKIDVAEHADGYLSDYLPLAIINGSKPGSTLWIEAGFHGDEVDGIVTAFRLIDELDPEKMRGAVIVEPCVNVLSFLARWRYNPVDLGMMAAVEGNTIPTFSERLGKTRSEIQQVLKEGDHYLSLHGPGDGLGETYIEIELSDPPTPYEEKCLKFAEATGALIIGGGPGRKVYAGRLRAYAPRSRVDFSDAGIIRITLESKEPYKHVMNSLKYLKIVEGAPEPPERERIYCKEGARVMSTRRGLWIPRAMPGDMVYEGEVVAVVRNLMGEVIEEVRSPYKGVVILQTPNARVDSLSIDQSLYYGALVGRTE